MTSPCARSSANDIHITEGGGVVIETIKENMSTEVVNNSKERHEYRFAKGVCVCACVVCLRVCVYVSENGSCMT